MRFVLFDEDEAVLRKRLEQRRDHFIPGSLLTCQLATLEPPTPDEGALVLGPGTPCAAVVDAIVAWLDPAGPHA